MAAVFQGETKAMRKEDESIKSYLCRIKDMMNEAEDLATQIDSEHMAMLPSGIRYDLEKVQTSPQDRMPELAAEVADYQKELTERLIEIQREIKRADAMISRLKSSRQKIALRKYYLRSGKKTMQQVADEMHYSREQVKRFMNAGIKNLEKMTQNDPKCAYNL